MSNVWDVICVGAGSAGLPLAIKAAERGAKVLQIDADKRIGGTLHWSSGQISAAGTRLQKENNIDDSPDAHYEDAQRIANGQIDPTVLRLFVDNAANTIDWLIDIGFKLKLHGVDLYLQILQRLCAYPQRHCHQADYGGTQKNSRFAICHL
jgi:succinate dehydrogenase/fumarate reductase flavoprotein subunit